MSRPRLSQDSKDPRFAELVRLVRQSLGASEPISPDTPLGDIEEMAHTIGQAVGREVCLQAIATSHAELVSRFKQPFSQYAKAAPKPDASK
jgi:hypothetical protein